MIFVFIGVVVVVGVVLFGLCCFHLSFVSTVVIASVECMLLVLVLLLMLLLGGAFTSANASQFAMRFLNVLRDGSCVWSCMVPC